MYGVLCHTQAVVREIGATGMGSPSAGLICSPGGSVGKGSACSAGDPSSIPGSGRSAREGTAIHSSVLGLPWWLSQ